MKIIRRIPLMVVLFLFFLVTFILFSIFPIRLDLSKGGAYTLAAPTKKIIRNIDKPVNITIYLSSDLPTRIIPLKTDALELLQEYRRGSNNIKVTVIDPKKDTKVADQAKQLGIPELQFSQLEQNKYQTSSFYFGMGLSYNGKSEVIPQVSDYQNLEYNIASAIYRLTRTTMPKVAIVGEAQTNYGQQDPLSTLKQVLSQQYTVVSIDLSTIKPEDVKTFLTEYATVIVLGSGTTQYSTDEIKLLKELYMSGKNIVVFGDGARIDEQTLTVTSTDNNLNELTASYGAQINYDLALSSSAEYVNFGNSSMQFLAPYPFWIRTNSFNTQSGLFANVQYVSFPWVSSLSIKRSSEVTSIPLITSSDRSWVQKDTFSLNPNTIPRPTQKDLGQYILGVLLKNKKGGEMVIIPSSRFPLSQYMGQGSGNLDFVLNTIDTFSSNGALSGIRSRVVSFYPIPDMSDARKDAYKYTAILLFPLLWGIYGAVRLLRRK